ncbi:Ferredoxin-2 [Nymphon striatum]|nr:Ferredoxin-2 [Nymphon striatum]
MLVIHPDECIDCGVCEPECPADAIRPDTEPDMDKWVEFNRKYSEMWPVIITKKDPLPEAEERDGEAGKLEKYFSEAPGEGASNFPSVTICALEIAGFLCYITVTNEDTENRKLGMSAPRYGNRSETQASDGAYGDPAAFFVA